jgi:uncharacterized protein (DUF3084 family)
MRNNIKLIEQRIGTVVDRLKELSSDRDAARAEAVALREELETLRTDLDRDDDDSRGWQERRAQAVGLIRETLAELRDPAAG